MKNSLVMALLVSSSAFVQTHIGYADAPENILAKATGYKPVANCSDKYSERILTFRSERVPGEPAEPPTHDVGVKPQRIAARIVANIEGFDPVGLQPGMPLEVTIGDFSFQATLGESREAATNGGRLRANGSKATYLLYGTVEKPNGEEVDRIFGRVIFTWTDRRLTVLVACSNIDAAGASEIAASAYIGLYEDLSPLGNRPSGRFSFDNEANGVSLVFGDAFGEIPTLLKGGSSTIRKRFGTEARGTLEEFELRAVSLSGRANLAAVAEPVAAEPAAE